MNHTDQDNSTKELHDFRWAPFPESSDQLADFNSNPIQHSPSSLQLQLSNQQRSYSGNAWTDVGGQWHQEGPGTAGHFGSWVNSASPSIQVPVDEDQLLDSRAPLRAFDPQSLRTTGSTSAWTATINPSGTESHYHAPLALSRRRSLNPQLIERSIRRRKDSVEAVSRPDVLVPAEKLLLQPLASQRPVIHGQSPSTTPGQSPKFSPSQSSLPTQSITSDPRKAKFPAAPSGKRKKTRRKAHNAIERRYRSRLNDKIAGLRDSIPSLRAKVESEAARQGPSHDPTGSSGGTLKVNKAEVLEKATEYVKHLENTIGKLEAQLQQSLALSRESSLRGSPPSNYSLAKPYQEIQPPLRNEYRFGIENLQGSSLTSSDYELLQYRSPTPETVWHQSVGETSERHHSQGEISFNTFRRSS